MAQTSPQRNADAPSERLNEQLLDDIVEHYEIYYRDEIARFAERYPDSTLFEISWQTLSRGLADVADDYLIAPEEIGTYLDEALRMVDLPIDVGFKEATVVVGDLPEWHTHYPGEFSPTEEAGTYRSITGEVSKATDVYSKITEACFECVRCETRTDIPQDGSEFQEPHECAGCDRQGPFNIILEHSSFVDAQKLRLQTPPEIAQGASTDIDVFVEGELADKAGVGDRVTVSGVVHLEQQSSGNKKQGVFYPYVNGRHIEREETDIDDLDITPTERERIEHLASGAEGDPLDLAAESLAPKIYGYDQIKRMSILAMVGGARTEYASGDFDRGEFHMLLLGDPGTAKSKLVSRIEQLAYRSVGVSGKRSTTAGLTATTTQDDFGDGEWTLEAGAFVKANGGIVCIDELDDMAPDDRAAMLEPMSKQTIHVTQAGINTHLQTRTAVVAAGNPKNGRFDPTRELPDQFDLGATLLSRFDLIYTLQDRPEEEMDRSIAGHILTMRDSAKRRMRGDDVEGDAAPDEPPIDAETLRKWIALAKQHDPPVFESDEIRETLRENFVEIRGSNGYDPTAPVPVTHRKLEGVIRVAEAAAKFEFSDAITERHAKIAMEAVGRSMQDFGKDEDGRLDVDIQETGSSHNQKDRMERIAELITDLEGDDGGAPYEEVVEAAMDEGIGKNQVEHAIEKLKRNGNAYSPKQGRLRYVGSV